MGVCKHRNFAKVRRILNLHTNEAYIFTVGTYVLVLDIRESLDTLEIS